MMLNYSSIIFIIYMFIMYTYETGVLDKVPNYFFTKTKEKKKKGGEDLWKTVTRIMYP